MGEDTEQLIAYCGLYCGDCHGYTGRVADLARDLRKELRQTRYDRFAAFLSTYNFGRGFKNYAECYEVLGNMVKFRCRKGCRDGGGSPFCKMRQCCQKKGLNGCWECDSMDTCPELDFLKPVHGVAHLKNLHRLKKQGTAQFLSGKRYW